MSDVSKPDQTMGPDYRSVDGWRLGTISMGVGAVLWAPSLLDWRGTGYGDWQMFTETWEAARIALMRHGEFPLWNPNWCGGITLWGNPETQIFYPLFYLALLLGTTAAFKLYLVAHTAIGFSGMYVFAKREYGLSFWSCVTAALTWTCSGTFVRDGGGGHVTLLMFYWAPWIVLSFRRACEDLRFAALTALLLGLVALGGGTYPFPYLLLLLAFDGLVQLRGAPKPWNVVRAGILTGSVALLMAAVRIIPSLVTLRDFPRHYDQSTESLSLKEYAAAFVTRDAPEHWAASHFGWWEYDAFVGWIALGLVAVGIVSAWRTQAPRKHLILGALLFSSFAVGYVHPLAPWSLLSKFPVFSQLRVPSRFLVWTIFYLALLAAMGLAAISNTLDGLLRTSRHRLPKTAPTILVMSLALATSLEMLSANIPKGAGAGRAPPLLNAPPHPRFHYIRVPDYWYVFANFPQENVGTNGCYSEYRWPVAEGLWMGDVPQARVVAGEGRVTRWHRTANHATLDVTMQTSGTIVLNHNFARGWTGHHGAHVFNHNGQLAVALPRGKQRITVSYRPADLPWAIGLSLVGFGAGLLIATRQREPSGSKPKKRDHVSS
ncbi:MAG: hypothetical protein H6714_04820 [Myxococcales bacterium]|nr:hypothetical protein [Myxococcales bacterium]